MKSELRLSVMIAALTMPHGASAVSLEDRCVETLFRESAVVVEGTVRGVSGSCDAEKCSTAYQVFVENSLKSNPRQSTIEICAAQPMSLGQRFTFFLYMTDKQSDNNRVACSYTAFFDGIFTKGLRDEFYRYMSIDGSNNIVEFRGRRYLTYMVEQPRFANELGALIDGGQQVNSQCKN